MDDLFKNAHLTSWPKPYCGMSRELFNRRKKEVMMAAKIYGYVILGATKNDPESKNFHSGWVHFMRPEDCGDAST